MPAENRETNDCKRPALQPEPHRTTAGGVPGGRRVRDLLEAAQPSTSVQNSLNAEFAESAENEVFPLRSPRAPRLRSAQDHCDFAAPP